VDWLRQNIIGIVGAVLALGAIGVSVYIFWLQRDVASLTVQLTSNTNLVSTEAIGSTEQIEILFEKRPVRELWLAAFRLVNDGNVPIKKEDFEQPIGLQLNNGEVLKIIAGQNIQPQLLLVSKNTVEIQPLLLNPSDVISFSLLTTSSAEELVLTTRISGVPRLKRLTPVEAPERGFFDPLTIGGTIAAAIGFLSFLLSFWVLGRE
jgi:hypothetical protein